MPLQRVSFFNLFFVVYRAAWCESNQMLLGMSKVDSKSNEIVGIHEILNTLLLQPGDLITIDAIGCPTSIVAKIIEQNGFVA
jgi:hypothetical protein